MVAGERDFDFFIGSWSVRHRRLKDRLADCTEWQEFGGWTETRKILGGLGNCDDNLLELPGDPYRALTLRTFDPASGEWSIWWLDGRQPHTLDAPMRGRFADGVGSFYADDTLRGQAIRVRFLWRVLDDGTPLWEQAFSGDGGASWETNWTMEFLPRA